MELPGWRTAFGVVAGITRRGDDSDKGFDLGLWGRGPVGDVMSRWREFRRAEPGFRCTILGTQVHGARTSWHTGGQGWIQLEEVDGHGTASPGVLLTVTVADCIPVYLVDPRRRAIALLHCGWRGTAQGLLKAGVETLLHHCRSATADIVMHCGVGICGDCYEVGREVMEGCGQPADGPGPWHVDLRAVLAEQASSLGIAKISTSQWCSSHDHPTFFSHRASGGKDGRMVAYLGIPAL